MFESVRPDPGQQGLTKAARIFFVLAVLCVIVALFESAIAVAGHERPPFRSVAINLVLALTAVTLGNGIEKQRPWAKWLGFGVAALELLNFPIGTAIGIALIVHLYRASKAGLL
jgi:hypothetical protein